eukprot:28626-Pelagococcus_subviridis.AAC.7
MRRQRRFPSRRFSRAWVPSLLLSSSPEARKEEAPAAAAAARATATATATYRPRTGLPSRRRFCLAPRRRVSVSPPPPRRSSPVVATALTKAATGRRSAASSPPAVATPPTGSPPRPSPRPSLARERTRAARTHVPEPPRTPPPPGSQPQTNFFRGCCHPATAAARPQVESVSSQAARPPPGTIRAAARVAGKLRRSAFPRRPGRRRRPSASPQRREKTSKIHRPRWAAWTRPRGPWIEPPTPTPIFAFPPGPPGPPTPGPIPPGGPGIPIPPTSAPIGPRGPKGKLIGVGGENADGPNPPGPPGNPPCGATKPWLGKPIGCGLFPIIAAAAMC